MVVAIVLLCLGAYGTAELAIGKTFLPDGEAWSLGLIWAAAHTGGFFCSLIKVPPLLGMLLSGILLVNLPGDLVTGLPADWSSKLRAGALAIILCRSGLELDLGALRRAGGAAVRLTACPGVVEAVVISGAAALVWSMPIALGLTLGFILAAVSPAVVVSGMFDLQKRGFGVKKGIPSLVVAAASFDDVLAITGYSLCVGLAVPSGHSLALEVAHGPINVVAGVGGGLAAGVIAGSTRLWSTPALRTIMTLLTSQFLMHLAHHFHYTGAGALASLVMAIVASKLWAKENMPFWFRGDVNTEFAHECEHDIALFWKWVAQPMLFGIIGTAVNFNVLSPATIPKALAVVIIGVAVRLPTASGVTWGAGLNLKERLFIGGSWLAKATVQAALASAPLDLINDYKKDSEDYEKWKTWGEAILTTAVLSIVLTAPLGLLFISYFGDKCLQQDVVQLNLEPPEDAGKESDERRITSEQDGISPIRGGVYRVSTGAGSLKERGSLTLGRPSLLRVSPTPGLRALERVSGQQRRLMAQESWRRLSRDNTVARRSTIGILEDEQEKRTSFRAFQKASLTAIDENAAALEANGGFHEPLFVVTRSRLIRESVQELEDAILSQSLANTQHELATPGNFFRFAKRTEIVTPAELADDRIDVAEAPDEDHA